MFYVECRFNDIVYNEGDQIQPNCSALCTCRNGSFQCVSQHCGINGASCYVSGNSHYLTFDHRYFNFQGTCEYVLTQSCNTEQFAVIITNSAHNQYVSCTDTVRVVVPNENLNILLGRGGGGTVTINDILQANNGDEVILRSGEVEVVRVGGHPHVILSISGVRVSWDGLYRVAVTVSTSWRGRLCGLCGNYNDDPNDDFQTPDGSMAMSANEFGLNWVLNNGTHDICHGSELISPGSCSPDLMTDAIQRCNKLNREPFNICNNLINSNAFIDSCVYDYCYSSDAMREQFYYSRLSTYVTTPAKTGHICTNYTCSGKDTFLGPYV